MWLWFLWTEMWLNLTKRFLHHSKKALPQMFSIINIFIIPEGLDKLVGHQLHLVVLEGLRKLSSVPNLVSREKKIHTICHNTKYHSRNIWQVINLRLVLRASTEFLILFAQLTKSAIETLEKGVKYVQSWQ